MRTGTCQRPSSEIRGGPWSTKAWRILGLTVRAKIAKARKLRPSAEDDIGTHRHRRCGAPRVGNGNGGLWKTGVRCIAAVPVPVSLQERALSSNSESSKIRGTRRTATARLARERRTGRRCRALGTERLAAAGMPPSMRRTHDADGRAIRWWRVLGRPPRVCGQTARYDMSAFGAGAARATVDEHGREEEAGPRGSRTPPPGARWVLMGRFSFPAAACCRQVYAMAGRMWLWTAWVDRTQAAGRRRGSRRRLRRDRAGDAKRIAALGSLTGRLSHF